MSIKRLDELLEEGTVWARETFGTGNGGGTTAHYLDELDELVKSPFDPEEMADVILLMYRVARLNGFELVDAVEAKLAKNRARVWGEPDERGVAHHID